MQTVRVRSRSLVGDEQDSAASSARTEAQDAASSARSTSAAAWWSAAGHSAEKLLLWLGDEELLQSSARDPRKAAKDESPTLFRPVSTTLICVIWLTLLSILLRTGLAVSENLDDFWGKTEPSYATQVLEVAFQTTSLCPVLCCLFIAKRMVTLMATDGLGSTKLWVQCFMYMATVGVTLQAFTVVLFAAEIHRGGLRHIKHLPESYCETPQHVADHNTSEMRWPVRLSFAFFKEASFISIWVGALGIVWETLQQTALLAKERWSTAWMVSTSPITSIAPLAVIYLFIKFGSFVLGPPCAGSTGITRIRAAIQAASVAVEKAPMLMVLCLAAQLRENEYHSTTVQSHPPITAFFFPFATAVLHIEVMTAMGAGSMTVRKPTAAAVEQKAGEYVSEEHMEEPVDWTLFLLRLLTRLFAAAGYTAAMIIVLSFRALRNQDVDAAAPLSPTLWGMLTLALVFYSVHIGFWFLSIMGAQMQQRTLHDALLTASQYSNMCPVVCTLFLAARMRALQISNQEGDPQWWEQDCLCLCVLSAILEALCCLALPFFFKEVSIDFSGRQTFSVGGGEAMLGATLLTLLRYFSLLGQYFSLIVIIISVAVITPEAARANRGIGEASWWPVVRTAFGGAALLAIAFMLTSAKVAGLFVKLAIESMDTVFLNTDIYVQHAVFSIWRGMIVIQGLTVNNPYNHNFESKFLMKADMILVKISICKFICSFGKMVELPEIVATGVDINFEQGADGGPSNVHAFMEHLEVPMEAPKEKGTKRVHIGKVLVQDTHAQIIRPGGIILARIDLGTIQEDLTGQSTARAVQGVMRIVMRSLFATVRGNAQIARHLVSEKACKALSSALSNAKMLCTAATASCPKPPRCFATAASAGSSCVGGLSGLVSGKSRHDEAAMETETSTSSEAPKAIPLRSTKSKFFF